MIYIRFCNFTKAHFKYNIKEKCVIRSKFMNTIVSIFLSILNIAALNTEVGFIFLLKGFIWGFLQEALLCLLN